MATAPPPATPATVPLSIPVVVGQVVQTLQQIQGQKLPPPASMPPVFVVTAELLGQDPGRRRSLNAASAAVQAVWDQVVQGLPAGRRYVVQAGSGQSAAAGTALSGQPTVRVTNIFGQPVPGLNVAFSVTSGGGTVANTTNATNGTGDASAGVWTLGGAPGLNTLTASVGGVAVAKFWAIAV